MSIWSDLAAPALSAPALSTLAGLFGQLSLIALGGVNTVLPELQRQVVDVHRWMSDGEFVALYGLAQAAPGPNMLISTLIGYRVAGVAGGLVATAALIGPPALLAYVTARLWHRFRDRPWRRVVQAGLTPVTAGLVMSAAILLCLATATSLPAAALSLATALVLLTRRVHPLWMLALGAVLGVAGVL